MCSTNYYYYYWGPITLCKWHN